MFRKHTLFTSVAFAALALSAQAQSISGFGRDIPLSFAVEQIAPENIIVSYGPGVNVSRKVSWTGGSDWKRVMEAVLLENGMAADFSQTDRMRVTMIPNSGNMMSNGIDIAAYAAAVPAQRSGSYADGLAGTKSNVTAPAPTPKVNPEPVKAATPAAPANVITMGPLPTATVAPVSAAAQPAGPVLKIAPAVTLAPPVRPEEIPRDSIVVGVEKADLMPSASVWVVNEGQTLERVLTDWADKAGWIVIWNSEYSYPIEAPARFDGTFVEAASTLIKSFSRAKPAVSAEFFTGNEVLVITTESLQNG